MKRWHLLIALCALCAWLGASTKTTAGAKRLLMVDTEKQTLYPASPVALLGAKVAEMLEALEAQDEALATLATQLSEAEAEIESLEAEVEE